MACVRFENPQFLPISRSHINSVQIDIRDDAGKLFPFENGKAVLMVLMRRKLAKFYM